MAPRPFSLLPPPERAVSLSGPDPADRFVLLDKLGAGNFGVVWKAIDKVKGKIVAVKMISGSGEVVTAHIELMSCSADMEESEDGEKGCRTASRLHAEHTDIDIEEIQLEIAHLAQCDTPYVTRLYDSFVRGYKLWIVMEYLAGGSGVDLVRAAWARLGQATSADAILAPAAQARHALRSADRRRRARDAQGPRIPALDGQDAPRYQGRQCTL